MVQNTAQNSSDNLPSYPPDNHHSSHIAHWRENRFTSNTLPVIVSIFKRVTGHVIGHVGDEITRSHQQM